MSSKLNDIIDFVKEFSGRDDIKGDTDLFMEAGIVGDDFDEMIKKYSEKYSVNMDSYLWYFHTDEESGWNSLGSAFFKPPYNRVERVPITPKTLDKFATLGKWDIVYPNHQLPKYRFDILINQIIVVSFLIVIIIYFFAL